MIGEWVYVNGQIRPKEQATVSVFDHGFLYGDGVFEGMAVVNGGVFKLDAHLDRLFASATYLAIAAPDRSVVRDATIETARRNALAEGYLRVLLTRGAGPVGIRNMAKLGSPTLVIIGQHETRAARASIYENGLKAVVSSIRRIPPQCVDGKAKTCNYVNNILAYLEARQAGADTAILLDVDGYVAENYAANLFVVARGVVKTPRLGSILNGITRQTVLHLCAELDLPHDEAALTVHDLYCADEIFETGSLAEIKPISFVGGRSIGAGTPGPVTRRLHVALRALMDSGSESTAF
jgi:branched-chain amino acid aminotransferase